MKLAILDFSQARAVKAGLTGNDLIFLDWFMYFYGSGRMEMIQRKNRAYGWINRRYVLDQLPILGLSHENSVTRMLTKLTSKEALVRVVVNNAESRGARSFYRPGPLIAKLFNDSHDQQTELLSETPKNSDQQTKLFAKTPGPANQNVCPYTPSVIYTPSEEGGEISRNTAAPDDDEWSEGWGDTDPEEETTLPEPSKPKGLSPLKDPISNSYQDQLTKITPPTTWTNIARERQNANKLGKLTRNLSDETGLPADELVSMILSTYSYMKKTIRKEFWSNAPFTPSAVLTRWAEVVEQLRTKVEAKKEAKENMYVPRF